MLRKLIRIMAEGQARSLGELARQLRVDNGLLEQMLEYLARQGYVKSTSTEFDSACAGCPSAVACSLMQPIKTWVLTKKGHELEITKPRNHHPAPTLQAGAPSSTDNERKTRGTCPRARDVVY